jgi:tight adherence protein C
LDELPVLCELLSLCLTAGEGFADALERVSARGTGPLALELRASIRSSTLGVPLATALTALARRLDISALTRTIDSIVGGLERGTPLAAVLRTQSSEARAEAARRLQEQASSREVAMLVPLIFLILPVTIAFAIFPGLLVIQSGF